MLSRRSFVSVCAAGVATVAYPIRMAFARTTAHDCASDSSGERANDSAGGMVHVSRQKTPHPKPRTGITGANVLTAAQLADHEKLIPLFDSVRKIPQIIDGIRCNCGCGHPPEMYSLLSCYEGEAMARECAVCQGQGKLAARLHSEGKSLAEIRIALDAKFG
ncbi:MAG: hypothetical protein ABJB74_19970 [Gemmatimonas sp.]